MKYHDALDRYVVSEAETVMVDKYEISYEYTVKNAQTGADEVKTGSVTFTVPQGVSVKTGALRKV